MVYGITIKNVGSVVTINGGKAIWFDGATRVTLPWKKEVKVPLRTDWDLNYAYEGGINNPTITIEGVINWNKAGTDYSDVNGEVATRVTDELLRQLVLFKENLETGNDSRLYFVGYWGGQPIRSFLTGSTGFYVVVESVNLNLSADSADNHIWRYQVVLREVK